MSFRFSTLKRNGRIYASIVEDHINLETRRRTTRSIKTFGDLEKARAINPDIEQKIRDEVERLNREGGYSIRARIEALSRHRDTQDAERALSAAPLLEYGIAVYRKIWRELGLDAKFRQYANDRHAKFDLNTSAFYLCASRLLHPSSKRRAFEDRGRYLFDFSSLSLDDLYAALDHLAASKRRIVRHLNKRLGELYERAVGIALYDVTTFYFESFDGDGLRERGMSKDNKTNETQVVLGLLIDADGMPLDYELFPGNTSEMKTMIEVINEYRSGSGLSKLTVIADRGLNSKQNLGELNGMGCDFIVAQSIDRMSGDIKERIFDETNWDEVSVGEKDDEIFKIKRFSLEDGRDLIVTWSSRRSAHDMKVLEERWAKANKLLDKGAGTVSASFSHGSRQFVKAGRGNKYSANDKLYEKRKKYAGYYALSTSRKDLSSGDVYANLRQLWKIEACFRAMKSDLEVRPVFVWTRSRIEGHFVMCYIALVMQRLLEHILAEKGIQMSTAEIVRLLNGQYLMKRAMANGRGQVYERVSHRSGADDDTDRKLADKIMRAAGIASLQRLETYESLKKRFGARTKIQ